MCSEKIGLNIRKLGKSSGGIAVMVKDSLQNACKFDPLSDSDVIWIRLQKHITRLNCDLYLAFAYLPPSNSTYDKVHGKEILQNLEKHIEYFSCKGKVIVCGDLNARVCESIDVSEKEDDPHLPVPHDGTYEFILPRASNDSKTINQYGKWLVDICTDNKIYIINGPTLGHLTGKFTCHTLRGSSVVDYFIASNSLSYLFFSMSYMISVFFSDHYLISMKLKICFDNELMSPCVRRNRIWNKPTCLTIFYGQM